MAEVVWNNNNEAEIVFCEGNSGSFGYKLAADTSNDCDPAGVLIRMSPHVSYKLTLRNEASVETNIHTHGLHISGSGNADDPRREVDPGSCLVYHWDIPSDHMGGTFWFHAHVHERTEAQVSGGAFGMIIIEEGTWVIDNQGLNDEEVGNIEQWYQNELLLVASKVGNTVLGNGLSNYEVFVNQNEWYRMRIVAVDPSKANDLEFPSGCTVHAAAHDGVWRFQVPKQTASSTYTLTGASRLDVAIQCSSGGSVLFGGKSKVVATIVVGSDSSSTASPFASDGSSWASFRPNYLRDLSQLPSNSFESYSISMTAAQMNGVSYSPDVPLGTWNYDTLQEWTIFGTQAHPYHLHVYHMQVLCDGDIHDAGEYYDTISAKSSCVVRFHIIDHGESVMMHCHFLSHEDNGSMTWAFVDGGPIQPTTDREQQTCPGSSPIIPAPTTTPQTDPPTPAPVAGPCSLAPVGSSCFADEDCCSSSCRKGNPATRVCIEARYLRW
jgi:FtsP/CotA-like multicopper oxidase with cupredoxin domain